MCKNCKCDNVNYKSIAEMLIYGQRQGFIETKDIDGFHRGLNTCIPLIADLLKEIDDLKKV